MNDRGILVVVSGFAGAGKGTVMKRLLEKYRQYALSVSVTTRTPREGEEEGREYFFRTKEEFERLIQEDAFLEYALYVKNYYGTPRAYVEEMLSSGKDVILEIEIQGAMKIKHRVPDALLVFVAPPSMEELERRIRGRGTETEEQILSRLARAGEEAEGVDAYDYLLINDSLEECVEELHHIICSEHAKIQRNGIAVENLVNDARALKDRVNHLKKEN